MKVRLSDYRSDWVRLYRDEAALLSTIFGDEIVRFEHVGSTSVPGMKAKPVIDMMGIVRDIESIDRYNDRMRLLGYDVAGEWGIPGRRLLRKGGEDRTHHIHFYQIDNPHIERHLIFRDYLRSHPEEAARYSGFKEELAERFEHTSAYSPAKKAFVSEMEQLALAWFAGRYPIGPFIEVREPDEEQRRQLIESIGGIAVRLRQAVEGAGAERLNAPYRPGGWTVRQVVHHLADAGMNAYIRFKRGLTEDRPIAGTFREDLWAELNDYSETPVEVSIMLLEALHVRFAILLTRMQPAEFQRSVTSPTHGAMTLDAALQRYVWHAQHHIAQINSSIYRK
ncbi:YfiT family bacillithiol transferase [Cohnella sp. 56]|uniref:YfiT family bacillithiol transferase n=1 Tax=Cohnella sp. 56 TaxID=3113722 RepID=UPI00403FEF08